MAFKNFPKKRILFTSCSLHGLQPINRVELRNEARTQYVTLNCRCKYRIRGDGHTMFHEQVPQGQMLRQKQCASCHRTGRYTARANRCNAKLVDGKLCLGKLKTIKPPPSRHQPPPKPKPKKTQPRTPADCMAPDAMNVIGYTSAVAYGNRRIGRTE